MTICAHRGQPIFGDIVDDKPRLSLVGQFVDLCWQAIPYHFPHVELDQFVVMPNHFHGILWIVDDSQMAQSNVEAQHVAPLQKGESPVSPPGNVQPGSLGAIVRSFKGAVTRRLNQLPEANWAGLEHKIWQRNYYERIVRNDQELRAIQTYIVDNPVRWVDDDLHPDAAVNKFNADWQEAPTS